MDYSDYSDLNDSGYEDKTPTDPKDEFFHSVYISGVQRTNQDNIVEAAGKLQIRGVEYNKDEIFMIITHTKQVHVKTEKDSAGKERLSCFSFRDGAPTSWYGTYKNHKCGATSADRAADPWCVTCRNQLVVAGLLCDSSGNAVKKEDGKPTFVFLRGKGMKFAPVSEYLSEISKMEIAPFFKDTDPVPANISSAGPDAVKKYIEERKRFEKNVLKIKRFVTKVVIGEVPSNFGPKKIFKLSAAFQIQDEVVPKILEISKKSLDKFHEKFNWTKNSSSTTGYTQPQQGGTDGLMPVDLPTSSQPSSTPSTPTTPVTQSPPVSTSAQKQFAFDDLDF